MPGQTSIKCQTRREWKSAHKDHVASPATDNTARCRYQAKRRGGWGGGQRTRGDQRRGEAAACEIQSDVKEFGPLAPSMLELASASTPALVQLQKARQALCSLPGFPSSHLPVTCFVPSRFTPLFRNLRSSALHPDARSPFWWSRVSDQPREKHKTHICAQPVLFFTFLLTQSLFTLINWLT